MIAGHTRSWRLVLAGLVAVPCRVAFASTLGAAPSVPPDGRTMAVRIMDTYPECSAFYPGDDWHWRLAGIIVGPDSRAALFARVGETRTVREGERIDQWLAAAIRPHQITVTCSGIERVLNPEEMSPAEAAEAARLRAAENARLDRLVDVASLKQQQEQQEAESILADATKRMTTPR